MSDLISFDYAIKYLLRDRADYEIVEDFISAVLETGGYSPIKITMPLERESNKESSDMKGSIVDLAVEDEKGNAYLVEIDRAIATYFLHKACFNTSRLIVDTLPAKDAYMGIKKVFHINVLYSTPKYIESYLYHIKSVVNKISGTKQEEIEIIDKNSKIQYYSRILPEYFVIALPAFSNIVSKTIDEWIYFIKNEKIHEGCNNLSIKKAYERFAVINMNQEDKIRYYKFIKDNASHLDSIMTSKSEGLEEGIAIGKKEGIAIGKEEGIAIGKEKNKTKMVKKMLRENIDLEIISKCSELTVEEVKKIKNKNNINLNN